jgi:hypothetical protein
MLFQEAFAAPSSRSGSGLHHAQGMSGHAAGPGPSVRCHVSAAESPSDIRCATIVTIVNIRLTNRARGA